MIFLLKKVMATIEVGIDTVDGSSDRGVKITTAVVVTCIVAASGGLIFGYDIGISGIFSVQLMLRNSYIYIFTEISIFFPRIYL